MTEKAQYFAQYYGQKVYMQIDQTQLQPIEVNSFTLMELNNYLILTPLLAITDEDAIEVERILQGNPDYDKAIYNIKRYPHIYAITSAEITDFLRSKGYALPWRDKSVEQLIELGWLKLIS